MSTDQTTDTDNKLETLRENLDALRKLAEEDPEYESKLVELVLNGSAGIYLTGSNQSSPLRCLSTTAFQAYFDQLYEQVETTSNDPLHKMMVEQLVISHHVIGRLMMNSANCRDTETLRTQIALAVQLMSEFRRMTQAVNSYEPRATGSKPKKLAFPGQVPGGGRKKQKGVA